MLNAAISSGGLKAFTAAFVIGSGCTAIWATPSGHQRPHVSGDISSAQSAGAQVIVSFGARWRRTGPSCTNTASLQAAYQSVINQYHLTHVDFDIEGAPSPTPHDQPGASPRSKAWNRPTPAWSSR